MAKSELDQQSGTDLKQAFLHHLPERIGAIEEGWSGLLHGDWNQARLTRLFQRVQDLAGSAGKFGLLLVGNQVYALEGRLKAFLGREEPPAAAESEAIDTLIRKLKQAADDAKRGGADLLLKPQAQRAQVFYLRYSDNLAPGLSGALEAMDCAVERFQRVDDLMAAYDRNQPGAVVVDAQMLPSLHPLTERLERAKSEHAAAPALTVISGSSNLNTRLSSMRAGADAFFVTPLDTGAVAARIKHLASPESHRPYRIMIVDDDPSQADFAAAILRKADMETCAVTEPLQVLDTLDAFRPDLILMDLYMPDADGMELTTIIREHNEFVGVPIVFVSGEQDTDKQLDALSVGGDDFIAKPIRPRHLIATIKNRVQRVRALQGQPSSQSRRDPVTGLFNRRHFFERLDNAVASSTPHPGARGVLYLELDRRDQILAQIGAGQADALLAEIGSLIAAQAEPQDVCARMGDASFAVLAKRPLDKNLMQLAESLVNTVAEHRFESERLELQPTLSLGLCFFAAAPDDASGLVNRASKSCALAGTRGGNRVEVHDAHAGPGSTAPVQPRDPLALVRDALRDNGFQVLFQPFVDLHDRERENYEIMLRLRSADGDQIGAAEFLPAAKQAGLLRDIDRWIATRALNVLDERRQAGGEVRLLIAQTADTLADRSCAEWLRDELRRRLLVGTGLILEFGLVDTAADLKAARGLITELKSMGVGVCLSRFGHNDASYKILQFLGAEYIKVGEKLLQADPTVTAVLVRRAHALKARVIVPQVDDPRVIGTQWLSGADFVQGDAIQRPHETPDYDFSDQP